MLWWLLLSIHYKPFAATGLCLAALAILLAVTFAPGPVYHLQIGTAASTTRLHLFRHCATAWAPLQWQCASLSIGYSLGGASRSSTL